MAGTLDTMMDEIRNIQQDARKNGFRSRRAWPMMILRTPKGWTCPKKVDGKAVEGTFRAHQVPVADFTAHPDHVKIARTMDAQLPRRRNCSTKTAPSVRSLPNSPRKASVV